MGRVIAAFGVLFASGVIGYMLGLDPLSWAAGGISAVVAIRIILVD